MPPSCRLPRIAMETAYSKPQKRSHSFRRRRQTSFVRLCSPRAAKKLHPADDGTEACRLDGTPGIVALFGAGLPVEILDDRIDCRLDAALLDGSLQGPGQPRCALSGPAGVAFRAHQAAGQRAAERGGGF